MHRSINSMIEKRLVEFLGEKTLAAGVLEAAVLNGIACRHEGFDGKARFRHVRGFC